MKELRKCVFNAMKKYVDAYLIIKDEALKTGAFKDNQMHTIQAEINAELNQKFDEAEERIKMPKKKGIFGR